MSPAARIAASLQTRRPVRLTPPPPCRSQTTTNPRKVLEAALGIRLGSPSDMGMGGGAGGGAGGGVGGGAGGMDGAMEDDSDDDEEGAVRAAKPAAPKPAAPTAPKVCVGKDMTCAPK